MPETQGPGPQEDILRRIVASKRGEVAALAPRARELRARAADAPPARPFRDALSRGDRVAVIAEVKRRSPGAGPIRPGLDPADLARSYEAHGAAAASVLTDREYFGGGLEDLRAVRAATGLPALRKDFTIAAVQVDEARAAGADAVLLIVRILEDEQVRELRERAEALGMATLVEVHGAGELERALACGASLVGVNNRDLRTFRTDLSVTEALLGRLPPDVLVVSESGIRHAGDVSRLGAAGVDAVLVGEALLRADDPAERLDELTGHARAARVGEGATRG